MKIFTFDNPTRKGFRILEKEKSLEKLTILPKDIFPRIQKIARADPRLVAQDMIPLPPPPHSDIVLTNL